MPNLIAILTLGVLLLSPCASAQAGSDAGKTEDALTKAWEDINSRLGPDKWETGIALGNLARFYRDQKRFAEAVPFYERVLAVAKAQQRENSPLGVIFMQELAKVYRALDRSADAERLEKLADAASRILEPGAKKINPKDGLIYVWIPPDQFNMGCSPADDECESGEKPLHAVTISHGFWIGQTTVTVGAYQRYSQSAGKPMPPEKFGDRLLNARAGNDNLPAVGMTREEAAGYCGWAGMRLPTEAEWELAARAGTTGARYGNLDEIASYGDNSGKSRIDSTAIWNADQTSYGLKLLVNGNGPRPVAQKQPNGYGLYDMLGNLWQWMADWYSEKYFQVSEQQDPHGPPAGTTAAVRGGSWGAIPRAVRVSSRGGIAPNLRGDNIGVRCAGEGTGLVDAPASVSAKSDVEPPRTYQPRSVNEAQTNMKTSVRKVDQRTKYVFEVSFDAPAASDRLQVYEFRIVAGIRSAVRQIQAMTGNWNAGDRVTLQIELEKEFADAAQGWDLRFCIGTGDRCVPSPNLLF
jgi:formylglycine-generating enzyme required for sulfatase activity